MGPGDETVELTELERELVLRVAELEAEVRQLRVDNEKLRVEVRRASFSRRLRARSDLRELVRLRGVTVPVPGNRNSDTRRRGVIRMVTGGNEPSPSQQLSARCRKCGIRSVPVNALTCWSCGDSGPRFEPFIRT